MFVVTGLHTKRRPIGIDKYRATIEKQRVGLLRHIHPTELSSPSSARRVSEPRMTRNDSDRNAWNRNEKGRRPPIKFALGRPAPARVRKFIPKPLILVERMKARQLLLESSSPVASQLSVAPDSLNRSMTAMTTPLSAYVTPTPKRMLTCSVLSSSSHSSSSISFRMSSRKGIVFKSAFGMMPRLVRPLSVVSLGDSSSSTDTFVADSPCCIKQTSKPPVLVMEIDTTNVHVNVESDPKKKGISDIGVSVPIDSVARDFMHRSCRSTDAFEPVITSTPFASSQANSNDVPSPTAFITSTVYPTRPSGPMPRLSDSSKILSPTSQAVYPFYAPKGAYIVKLPNTVSTTSLSNQTRLASISSTAIPYSRHTKPGASLMTLANAPDFKRLSSRVASPPPTLVLDGVFALPGAPTQLASSSSSPSPRQTLNRFPRPRKPSSRRPPPPPPPTPSDTLALAPNVNALAIAPCSPPPHSPSSSRAQSGPESPRSKLAHVLTAHVRPQMMTTSTYMMRVHQQGKGNVQGRVPPLVKGVQASNDPRTQCEIEGLRMRRVVGSQVCRDGGEGSDGKGAIERMSLAGVGMVAKLRAKWERGEESCGERR